MSEIIDKLVNKAIAVLSRYKDRQEVKEYIRGIRSSQKRLKQSRSLTPVQEKEIQEFYTALLGHPVPLDWHRFFYSRTGHYSKAYFPTSEYKTNIVGRLNVYPLKRAYTDKNVTDLILPRARQPKIYLKNMNGYFYWEGRAVSKEEALEACSNLGTAILKPSLTARGQGVRKINLRNGVDEEDGTPLESLLGQYKQDYLLEEAITQHPAMAALNESSVNTIRLLTYRSGMDVTLVYSVIRIGRKDQSIDNESAGGISARINPDGTLARYAFGAPGVDYVEYTDSGVKLEGYGVPSFKESVAFVKEQHLYLPFFNLVAWDIAIDASGAPVMIEFNMTPDLSQSANGPAFGDHTEIILQDALKKKNTYSVMGKNWMWKYR